MSSNQTSQAPSPEYFQKLSANYINQTGNSTSNVFTSFLPKLIPSITPTTIIHDNACGIGTASLALVSALPSDAQPARIDATDFSQGMIDALQAQIKSSSSALGIIHPKVMDSQALDLPDNIFDVSITNISIATFKDPALGLREIHRTLQPRGLAIVSHWKRFGVLDLIHQAQKAVRADAEPMGMPRPEYMKEGYLRERMVEAGLGGEMEVLVERTVVSGDALKGLRDFMLGGFTASARKGWREEEIARWEEEIDRAIGEEVERWGGVVMEAWFVVGKKT